MYITVGETALASTAIAAFAVAQSIWTTLRTGRASREDRLWQRRAEIYVDLLTWAIRQRELSKLTPDQWLSKNNADKLPSTEDLIALEAKVSAFASRAVGSKVDELQEPWIHLQVAWGDLQALRYPNSDIGAMRQMYSESIGNPEVRAAEAAKRIKVWADELIGIVEVELTSGKSATRSRRSLKLMLQVGTCGFHLLHTMLWIWGVGYPCDPMW